VGPSRLLTFIGLGVLALVPACSSDDDDSDGGAVPASTTAAASDSTSAAPGDGTATTPAARAPEEPMTVPRDATDEIVDLLGTPGPSVERPEELAQAVADALVVEPPDEQCEAGPPTAVVASVTPGEPAFAVVDLRVGCDDSVAGARYDLAMEGDDSLGWVISSATRQDICRRGTGGEDLCP
jgi:hypothetical protein